MKPFTLLSIVLCFSGVMSMPRLNSIGVDNGCPLGSWGGFELCPEGTAAIGFSLKVEMSSLTDLTALNGIQLHCSSFNQQGNETLITSAVGG